MAGPRQSVAVPPSEQDRAAVAIPRPHSTAQQRSRGVLRALTGTWEGRAVVGGAAVKGAVWFLEAVFGADKALTSIDTLASIAVAAGAIWFFVRAIAIARRRLLWRVRRKLVLSYIFIGLIPALLIVAFFLLSGMLLFSNFSSYLLQTRLRELSAVAVASAETTALEIRLANGRPANGILSRRQQALASESPSASIALVPTTAVCGEPEGRSAAPPSPALTHVVTSGPWSHVEPPRAVPAWIGCDGFAGLIAYDGERRHGARLGAVNQAGFESAAPETTISLLVRAVAMPQSASGSAVIVDIPVNEDVKARLREDSSVELTTVKVITGGQHILPGRSDAGTGSDDASASGPLTSISFLEHRDWLTGMTGTLQASMQLSVRRIYARISAAQGSIDGRSLSSGFLGLLVIVGLLLLFIQVVAVVMGLALARSITGSVHELFTGTVKVRQGDFTHRIAVTARDQLGELAASFNSMTGSIENLLIEAAEKKRLEEELRIAHEIQMSLLPLAPASLPGLSVTALCVPAREVGGDYYDFLRLDEHRLAVLIADVAGKGTSAALYMAELKGLVISLSRTYSSPRELLMVANHLIAEHLDARSFITMTYAVIDLSARTMTYARAGHTPLMYYPGGAALSKRRVQVLAPDGLVLGLKIDDGRLFDRLLVEQTLALSTGDVCLFFTDGITEAMNSQDDCYGEHRLGRLIEDHGHLPCEELRERMLRDVEAFVGGAPQHDDMTMILLKIEDLPSPPPVAAAVEASGAAWPVNV
jgi:sigma-B regulation protein RsbU (phosphoserine phosphatase)